MSELAVHGSARREQTHAISCINNEIDGFFVSEHMLGISILSLPPPLRIETMTNAE
jgi:hypothetical protein